MLLSRIYVPILLPSVLVTLRGTIELLKAVPPRLSKNGPFRVTLSNTLYLISIPGHSEDNNGGGGSGNFGAFYPKPFGSR